MNNPVYRVTVQKLDADGQPAELVEMMEVEHPSEWTSIFDFVDQYREEMSREENSSVFELISAMDSLREAKQANASFREIMEQQQDVDHAAGVLRRNVLNLAFKMLVDFAPLAEVL